MSETTALSPESDGFWWLRHEGEWCPARVESQQSGLTKNSIYVRILLTNGGIAVFRTGEPARETWGGRIAPPEGLE